jgi:transposase
MIKLEFSEEDIRFIIHEKSHHPHHRVRLKMEVVWLKYIGTKHNDICKIANVSPGTMREYLLEFMEGGVDRLKEIKFRRQKSEMEAHMESLSIHFKDNPPASVLEAISVIEERTGIKRSLTQVRKFLKRMGVRRRKTGAVPAKADPDVQEEFKKKLLSPVLRRRRQENAPFSS